MHWFVAYLICLVSLLVIDGLFIGLFAAKVYRRELGPLVAEKIIPAPGIIFYLLYIAGVLLLSVWPLLHFFPSGSTQSFLLAKVFLWGAALGFFAYGTYGFTALTLIKGWKWSVTLIDTFWGAILTGAISLIGFLVIR